MRRLFLVGTIVSLLVAIVSMSWAETPGKTRSNSYKITGKVTTVNQTARTFTITDAKGQSRILSGARLPTLPKVGDVVDAEYTDTGGGGPAETINLNSSKSNIY